MTDTTGAHGTEHDAPETAPAADAALDPVAALAKEAADLKDRLLRTLAEMENLRRRTEREVADARAYGVTNFARDILAVADSMERALKALDDEIRDKADAGVKALLDGVELTERELIKVMEKHGVRRIEPQGQKFDPNLHQAMYEIPDAKRPGRHRGADHAARLHHRRARAASRAGRRIQGRAESAAAADAPANDNTGNNWSRSSSHRISAARCCRGSRAGAGTRRSRPASARSRTSANRRSVRTAAIAPS